MCLRTVQIDRWVVGPGVGYATYYNDRMLEHYIRCLEIDRNPGHFCKILFKSGGAALLLVETKRRKHFVSPQAF